jgi:hypothetical protein
MIDPNEVAVQRAAIRRSMDGQGRFAAAAKNGPSNPNEKASLASSLSFFCPRYAVSGCRAWLLWGGLEHGGHHEVGAILKRLLLPLGLDPTGRTGEFARLEAFESIPDALFRLKLTLHCDE